MSERADYALYTAKRYQRAGVVIFNAAQAQSLDRQKQVEEALMAADLDRELTLEYQPIYNIQAHHCIGFEAFGAVEKSRAWPSFPSRIHTDCRTYRADQSHHPHSASPGT